MAAFGKTDSLPFNPKASADGNTLVIGSMFPGPGLFMKKTPDDICDILGNTDQSLKLSLSTGASLSEFMKSNKPMMEDIMSGFGAKVEINLVSNFKQALYNQLKDDKNSKLASILVAFGPLFLLQVEGSVDIKF